MFFSCSALQLTTGGVDGRGVQKSPSKWGKSRFLGPGRGPAGRARGFGLGTDAKKIASRGNWWYIIPEWESKMDMPAEMNEPQIYARLAEIFQDLFDEDSIQLTPKLSAKDVDGWDSLTHIRLILTIEKTFKIKFTTSEIGKLENVGELVALIKARA